MSTAGEILVGVAIAVGVAGIVVPVLPGAILVLLAIGVWAWQTGTPAAWVVLGAATVVTVLAFVVKYAIPGRRLQAAGVPGRAMLAGSALGLVGFFVVPLLGLFVGFVLGVFAYDLHLHRDRRTAWRSTRHAMRAAGLSILIELTGALLAAAIWGVGLVMT
ncbi:MAG: DUF456 domain-containing protein [Nocardioidaceae bacterium]